MTTINYLRTKDYPGSVLATADFEDKPQLAKLYPPGVSMDVIEKYFNLAIEEYESSK